MLEIFLLCGAKDLRISNVLRSILKVLVPERHMSTIESIMLCTSHTKIYRYFRIMHSHGMLRKFTDKNACDRFEPQQPDLTLFFIFTTLDLKFETSKLTQ